MIFLGGQKASQRPHFAEQSIVGYTFVLAVSSIMLFRPKIYLWFFFLIRAFNDRSKVAHTVIFHHLLSATKVHKKAADISYRRLRYLLLSCRHSRLDYVIKYTSFAV